MVFFALACLSAPGEAILNWMPVYASVAFFGGGVDGIVVMPDDVVDCKGGGGMNAVFNAFAFVLGTGMSVYLGFMTLMNGILGRAARRVEEEPLGLLWM